MRGSGTVTIAFPSVSDTLPRFIFGKTIALQGLGNKRASVRSRDIKMEKRTPTIFRSSPDSEDQPAQKNNSASSSDLAALLRRASLSNSSYQEFPPQLKVIRSPLNVDKSTSHNQSSRTVQVTDTASAVNGDNRKIAASENPSKLENDTPQFREDVPSRSRVAVRDISWPALDNLVSKPKSAFDLIEGITCSIHVPTVFVTSMTGGVGVTTIAATLGHCLAKAGDHVAIAESEASLVLPFHFGASGDREGQRLQFVLPGCRHTIHVVKGIERVESRSFASSLPATDQDNLLLARVREVAELSTRFVFDASRLCLEDVLAASKTSQRVLIAIVPDFACTLSVLALEERLNAKLANSQQTVRPSYIFNKFDHEMALHRDIEALLKSHLGNRLLPVILRRSDSVSEALAKGMTVVDYCASEGISQDFQQLAEWARRASTNHEPETGRP